MYKSLKKRLKQKRRSTRTVLGTGKTENKTCKKKNMPIYLQITLRMDY